MQCVSVTMAGLPYTSPIIRLALFLPSSRQLQQIGHIVRHKTAKIIAKHSHAGTYITCLTLSQAAWTYNFFYVGNISIGESLDGRIFFEQIHHDYIYAGISALGCEPD